MDSSLLKKSMLCVTLFVLTVFLVILACNGVFSKKVSKTEESAAEAETESEDGLVAGADIYAWMSDETFFDAEKIGDGKYDVEEEVPVYLMSSSTDKDLRFFITDGEGKLISGRTFTVNVAGLGSYSDEDKDGIIYLADVTPGSYSVLLEHILGYAEPDEPLEVTVRSKIEYKAIADISYLIKTEADIDPTSEDTAVNDAAMDSSGTSAIKTSENALFGIDVSKWNETIDWELVRNDGVKYAIIRCGYRGSSSGSIIEDPYFKANIEGALEAGIPVGVYFYTQAVDEKEAVEEASAVMSLIKDYDITYPVFVDSESSGGSGRADDLEAKDRTDVLEAFCETIRSGGYSAGIYASKNWFNNRLDITRLSEKDIIWLAEYNDKPTYGASYQLWQYSSAGRINGIEGRVDMNLSYLDISDSKSVKKENDSDGQDNSRDL